MLILALDYFSEDTLKLVLHIHFSTMKNKQKYVCASMFLADNFPPKVRIESFSTVLNILVLADRLNY